MARLEFCDYNVNVDNPQKHLDIMETYVSFRVTTKVKGKEEERSSDDSEYIVRRRYNDFLWLRSKLIEAFPALVVPALPAKHSVLGQLDRYSRPFIMCRMALLHSYLNRIAAHPVFSSCPALQIFLTAKSSEFLMHSKGSNGLLNKLSGSLNTLAGYLPKHTVMYSEFDNVRQYVNGLSLKISGLYSLTVKVHRDRQELASDLEEGKKAISLWAKHESGLSTPLNAIQTAIGTVIACQNAELIQNYTPKVENPFDEYLHYVDAVKEALDRRDSIQLAYESSVEDSNRKHTEKAQLENCSNGFGQKFWGISKKDKIDKLESEMPSIDKMVEERHDQMEIANEGLRAELERWNEEKRTELKGILGNLAQQHIHYYQSCLQTWEETLATIKSNSALAKGSQE